VYRSPESVAGCIQRIQTQKALATILSEYIEGALAGLNHGSQIMNSELTAVESPTPRADEASGLLRRLLVLVSQLRLASRDLGDLSAIPKEHEAAALVIQETSAGLDEIYDRLCEWHARFGDAREGVVASGPAPVAESAYSFGLVLEEYASHRKIAVIRALREVIPQFSLTQAKALVESKLPTYIADGLAREEAEAMIGRLEAAGAICEIASFAPRALRSY
jgi:ribosomal protein L7/L12